MKSSMLHAAVASGDLEQVKTLLASSTEINALNEEGNTALMEAVRHHQPEIGFVLMEAGANLNLKNAEGNTALHLAVYALGTFKDKYGLEAQQLCWFFQELCDRGARPLKNHAGLLPQMTTNQDASCTSYSLTSFCRVEAQSFLFQSDADGGDYFKALCSYHRRALDPFSDLSAESTGSEALTAKEVNLENRFFSALRIGNVEAIKGLAKSQESIRELIEETAVVNFLIKEGAILSIDRVKEVIATLVQLGADLNKAEDDNGDTLLRVCMVDALHTQCSKKYPVDELVVYLLQCGVDPNRPSGMRSQGWGDTREFFRLIEETDRDCEEQALAAAKALLEHGASCGAEITRFNAEPHRRARMEQVLSRLIESYKTPDPNNLIDRALIPIMKPENITVVAAAIAQNLNVVMEDGFRVSISKVCDAVRCQKFSRYATHHLAYLLSLSKSPKIEAMPELTSEQKKQVAPLVAALSEADCQHSLDDGYARGGANDFKEGQAALMIQKHVRGYLAKKSLCASGEGVKHELPPAKFEMTP